MKNWTRTALLLAILYQLLILIHAVLLLFFPEVNPSFMISVEVLYAFAWLGWCLHKKVHELTGPVPFAGVFGVLYLVWNLSYRVLRHLDLALSQRITINILITAEAVFIVMLAVILFVRHNLPKDGPEL